MTQQPPHGVFETSRYLARTPQQFFDAFAKAESLAEWW